MLYKQEPTLKEYNRAFRGTSGAQVAHELKEKQALSEGARLEKLNAERQKTFSSVTDTSIKTNSRLNVLDSMYNKALSESLKNALGKIYLQALPLDKDFKSLYQDNIVKLVENKIESMGPISQAYAVIGSKNDFLKRLTEAAAKKAKAVVDKKREETKDSKQSLSDAFDSEDCDTLAFDDYEDMDMEEVCETIKDKVVDVVKTEEQTSQKQEQLIADISQSKAMNENVTLVKTGAVEQFTLFKSMMIKNYKQIVSDTKKANGSTMYANLSESGEISVNMDMVLCESVLEYTLFETFYTLGIEDHTANSVKKLAESIAYSKIK